MPYSYVVAFAPHRPPGPYFQEWNRCAKPTVRQKPLFLLALGGPDTVYSDKVCEYG